MPRRINFGELIDELCKIYPEYPREHIQEYIETYLEFVKESVCEGNKANLKGLGNFTVWKRKPRKVYDPRKQVTLLLDERYSVKFKTSRLLRERVNASLSKLG